MPDADIGEDENPTFAKTPVPAEQIAKSCDLGQPQSSVRP
jgi:hypothetical protein